MKHQFQSTKTEPPHYDFYFSFLVEVRKAGFIYPSYETHMKDYDNLWFSPATTTSEYQ